MPSLAELPEIVGFFSYSREDDEAFRRTLSAIRDAIQRYLSAQLGRTNRNFRLWQDQEALAPGKMWELKIAEAIEEAVFFIPIVTPRAVASKYCKFEFDKFLTREHVLGRNDLVFPIHYILVPALLDDEKSREDSCPVNCLQTPICRLAQLLQHIRQYTCFRESDRSLLPENCGDLARTLEFDGRAPQTGGQSRAFAVKGPTENTESVRLLI